MSKYNFKLNLEYESSMTKIIDIIQPNSRILEFGPAHGRLTKYMREVMNCQITIVELDEEAGEEASKYAETSFIGKEKGNIENYTWAEYINEKFDYIIFADVLEHLYNPKKVLLKAKKFLNKKGSIVVSIPNIAHNSILINLWNDEFKYTSVGLLDHTHIKFFTINSFKRMVSEIGLFPVKIDNIHLSVDQTEVGSGYHNISRNIGKELRNREKGNIYQYIFELRADIETLAVEQREFNIDKSLYYEWVLYIGDKEADTFSEENTIKSYYNPIGKKNIKIDIRDIESKQLRFDVLNTNCIVRIESILATKGDNAIAVNLKGANAIQKYNQLYFFNTDDPQIYLDVEEDYEELQIKFEILDYDVTSFDVYEKTIFNIYEELIQISKELDIKTCDLQNEQSKTRELESNLGIKGYELESEKNKTRELEENLGVKIYELKNEKNKTQELESKLGIKTYELESEQAKTEMLEYELKQIEAEKIKLEELVRKQDSEIRQFNMTIWNIIKSKLKNTLR